MNRLLRLFWIYFFFLAISGCSKDKNPGAPADEPHDTQWGSGGLPTLHPSKVDGGSDTGTTGGVGTDTGTGVVVGSDTGTGTGDTPPCPYTCIDWRECRASAGIYFPEGDCPAEVEVCCDLRGISTASLPDRDAGTATDTATATAAEDDTGTDTDTGSGSDTGTGTDTGELSPVFDTDLSNGLLVSELAIVKISVSQATEIPLMEEGEASAGHAAVVGGRDALVRVYVKRSSGWQARRVQATLAIASSGGSDILSVQKRITADSTVDNLSSTFNFRIPGDYLTGDLSYRVSLLDASSGGAVTGGDVSGAVWPDTGVASMGEEPVDAPLEVVLVPIRYDADGSSRLPDLSGEQIALYRDYFQRFYPVPNDGVEVTVGEIMPTENRIYPDGTGWVEILIELIYFRQAQEATVKQYYYGLVEPGASKDAYCGVTCVVGNGNMPLEPGEFGGDGNVAVGLGYPGDYSAETAIHEVGHNHGRLHAPCMVDDEESIDPNYPYEGGSIGVWGYDIVEESLKSPSLYNDFMGYCPGLWVSDYTFDGIFDWIQATNALKKRLAAPPQQWRSLSINGSGEVTMGPVLETAPPTRRADIEVILMDANQEVVGTEMGYATPFSHTGGALVLFPKPPAGVHFVSVDGSLPAKL